MSDDLTAFGPHTPSGFASRLAEAERDEAAAKEELRLAKEDLDSLSKAKEGGALQGRLLQALDDQIVAATARVRCAEFACLESAGESSELQERAMAWSPGERALSPSDTCHSCRSRPGEGRCLSCGRRFCRECSPGGGVKCPRCGGPVWREGEKRPPGLKNPENRGF